MRPLTLQRQVGALAPRSAARAPPRSRAISASWKALSSRQARDRVGAGRGTVARAHEGREVVQRHARPAARRRRRPERRAPALASASRSRTGAPRARDARAISAGSTPASSRVFVRAPGSRARASSFSRLAPSPVVEVVELQRRARARRSACLAGQLDVERGHALALQDRALQLEQQRRRQRRRADDDLLAAARPPGSTPRAGRRTGPASRNSATTACASSLAVVIVTAPRTSGNHSAQCSRSASRTKRARPGVAARSRSSRSFWPSVGTPAIVQRTARRSNRNSTARCHASSWESGLPCSTCGVLRRASSGSARRAARARRRRAGVRGDSGRPSRRRGASAPLAAAAAVAPSATSSPRRSRAGRARRRVSGSAWPGQAAAGSSAASLRIDARACSVSWLKAPCGTRGVALQARLRVERVEAVADVSARRSDSRHRPIMPGAWPGRWITRKPATSSPSSSVPAIVTGPPSQVCEQRAACSSVPIGLRRSKWK